MMLMRLFPVVFSFTVVLPAYSWPFKKQDQKQPAPSAPTCNSGEKPTAAVDILSIEASDRGGVEITRNVNGQPVTTKYLYTKHRTANWFWERGIYPQDIFDVDNLRKRGDVLDAGMGDGALVADLDSRGVRIRGIDLHVPEDKRKVVGNAGPLYLEKDMTSTGFPPNSFGTIFSALSVFQYSEERPEVVNAAFAELVRILKPGGRMYLGDATKYWKLDQMAVAHGLRVVRGPMDGHLGVFYEFEKP